MGGGTGGRIADYPRTHESPRWRVRPARAGTDGSGGHPAGDAHFEPRDGRPDADAAGRRRVVLTGADLTIADVEAVARHGAHAALDVHARARMQEARDVIERLVAAGEVVYGVTTGFGDLATTFDPAGGRRRDSQENLLVSHAAGVGAPVPARGRPGDAPAAREHARAGPLRLPAAARRSDLRAPAAGHPSGGPGAGERRRVRRPRAARASRAAARSAGARWSFTGRSCPALVALREVGLEPLTLEAKEGLALLNGTQLMAALGALLLADADRLTRTASRRRGDDASRRCSAPRSRSPRRTSSPGRIPDRSRSPPSCATSCATRDSSARTTRSAHKVQDPYSLRCVPQVHGAVRDALDHLRRVLDIELNSRDRQPARVPRGRRRADATPSRPAAARSSAAATSTASRSPSRWTSPSSRSRSSGRSRERRTALLVDPRLNGGLPAFLAPDPGRNSGLMIVPVHRRGPGVREQGAGPSGVGRLDPDVARTRRTTCRWARSPRGTPGRSWSTWSSIVAHRAAVRRPGARPAARDVRCAAARRRAPVWRRPTRASARSRAALGADREPGPDLAAATALVHDGRLIDLVGQASASAGGPAFGPR